MQITIDPLKHLPTATGEILDLCAKALGLPARELDDPTGHVVTYESDTNYRRRLGTVLSEVAKRCN